MEAQLSMTPSFEYSVPETSYRFIVMPRRIVAASPGGRYLARSKTDSHQDGLALLKILAEAPSS